MKNNSLDTIGGRLQYCRKIAKLTRPYLEKVYNISKSSIYCYEANLKHPSHNRIKEFLDIFKNENVIVNYQWLKTGKGDLPQEFKCINLSNKKKKANTNTIDSEQLIYQEEIDIKKMYSNAIFFTCDSFDLEPLVKFSDRVAGLPVESNIQKQENNLCIISYKEILFIKILSKYNRDGTSNFCGINPRNGDINFLLLNVQPDFIAPIFWIRRNPDLIL